MKKQNNTMNKIQKITYDQYDEILELFHESFGTVAKEFNITKENSKNNAAFMSKTDLEKAIEKGISLFGMIRKKELLGCVGIMKTENVGLFYIEKLCVKSEFRHQGIGKTLLEYAIKEIRNLGGKTISIGIIDENLKLKTWYTINGFLEYEVKKIEYLPFTVCLMKMDL
jgi:diamine N-acetyltransferase